MTTRNACTLLLAALTATSCAATSESDAGAESDSAASGNSTVTASSGGSGGDGSTPPAAGGAASTGAGGSGSGAAGGSTADPCVGYPYSAEALYAELVGFGEATTGGDPAQPYHVTTLSGSGNGSLKQALESSQPYWIVFDVEGKITIAGGRVEIESNKTIDGRGRDITIEGELRITHSQNVIISDVKLTNELEGHCTQAGDVISVRGNGTTPASYTSKNLWFHHVELFNGGDGLLDLRGASGVTISWSHLHTHKKAILASRNLDGSDADGMRVTFHHNFFDRITLRGPQFLYGHAHYFNNYQYEWYEYGAGSLDGAELLSEANIYQAAPNSYCLNCPDNNPCGDHDYVVSKAALVTGWSSHGAGYTKSVGDLALEGALVDENQPSNVFTPPYSYSAETASPALAATIAGEAGARVDYCRP
jgi:pectate lyase